jgi:CheY-like chemotaxis protein
MHPLYKKKRILAVDKDPNSLKVIELLLRSLGVVVLTSHTGADALALARSGPLDLMVTEIDLPDMNGIDVIRYVRKDPSLAHVPVIAVTFADDVQRREILAAGCDLCIQKPVDTHIFPQIIQHFLNLSPVRKAWI